MQLTVVHLSGSKKGTIETFQGDRVTCGRNPTNTIQFDAQKDLDVSADHCQFLVGDEGKYMIVDLGSKNGTFMNGTKIGAGTPVPVEPGSTVEFGKNGPKIKLDYVPGQKKPGATRMMLAQVQHDLEAQKAKAAAGKKKATIIVVILLLVMLGGGLTTFFVLKASGATKEAQGAIDVAAKAQKAADGDEAPKLAKKEYDAAAAILAEAKTLLEGGDKDGAKAKAAEAETAFAHAGKVARDERYKKLETGFLTKLKEQERIAAEQAAKLEKDRKDREAAELARREEERKKFEAELEAARKAGQDVAALQAKLDERAKEDAEKKRKADLVQEIFDGNKDRVVYIVAESFYEPAGNPAGRKIVTRNVGTGFIIADGWVATAKHVLQPYKYDKDSIARHTKYINDKKLKPVDQVTVWGSKDGTFQKLGEFKDKDLKVKPAADVLGEDVSVDLEWEFRKVTERVKPHKDYVNDVVILEVPGVTGAVDMAEPGNIAEKIQIVGLGTSKTGEIVNPNRTVGYVVKVSDAYLQVTEANGVEVYHGGPVFDLESKKVIGMTVGGGVGELIFVPIKEILALKGN